MHTLQYNTYIAVQRIHCVVTHTLHYFTDTHRNAHIVLLHMSYLSHIISLIHCMTHTWLHRMTHTLFLPLSFSSSLSLTPLPSLCSPLSSLPSSLPPPSLPLPSSFHPSPPLFREGGREGGRKRGREGWKEEGRGREGEGRVNGREEVREENKGMKEVRETKREKKREGGKECECESYEYPL